MDTLSDADRYYVLDTIILGSCQQLRKVFKNQWRKQSKKEWINTDDQKQKLISRLPLSKKKNSQLSIPHQNAVKEKSLSEWDMTLLAAVLLLLCKSNEATCNAVETLKTLRNKLAHVDSGKTSPENEEKSCFRSCSSEEFAKFLKEIKTSLRSLGMSDYEINKLVQKPGETLSFKALKRVQNLYRDAAELIKFEKLDRAIDCYSDAISTPNLFPEHLAEAHEKRAELYLKKLGSQLMDEDLKNQAHVDIQKALQLNSSSWKACYLAGQLNELDNQLPQAISYYQYALALYPGQKNVKQNLEACKWEDAMQNRHDHFNHLPMNEQERVNDWIEKTGIHLNEEEYVKSQRESAATFIPGQDHVFKGHQYRNGWWVEKDMKEAAKHYAKADEIGNPEGSYNLATCFFDGAGVERDIEKALDIYKRVALMDEDTVGKYTYLGKNIGVAAAKYTIGLLHFEGIAVKKDYAKAAVWYKKAMEIGAGLAANNLGRQYWIGRGVSADSKMAEMCWKQGINMGELYSSGNLVRYYKYQLEPELATTMLKISRDMGDYWMRDLSDMEFEKEIQMIKAQRDYLLPEVTNFEVSHGLDTKGFTFSQRLARLQVPFDQLSKSVIERKKYLQSPVRKEHIRAQRQRLAFRRGISVLITFANTSRPKLQQNMTHGVSKALRINLNEINPIVDTIYEDKVLHLTIIEDPIPSNRSIHLIAEDDNGDTTRLYIHNMGRDTAILDHFQVGSRISIINPYMWIGLTCIFNGIRNDEPKCITHLEKVEQMCRFCGEGNAPRKCAICKRPYCSRECQKLDWEMFKHKLICDRK